MPARKTIKSQGPDYYRQLLERPEGAEILKPNRAKSTVKLIRCIRGSWHECVIVPLMYELQG